MDWGARGAEEFAAEEVTNENVIEVVQKLVNLIGGGKFGSERGAAFWFKGMRFEPVSKE